MDFNASGLDFVLDLNTFFVVLFLLPFFFSLLVGLVRRFIFKIY